MEMAKSGDVREIKRGVVQTPNKGVSGIKMAPRPKSGTRVVCLHVESRWEGEWRGGYRKGDGAVKERRN